jgi:metallo-beta-lactamase class B
MTDQPTRRDFLKTTTLAENDPGTYDPGFWLDYFRRTKADAVSQCRRYRSASPLRRVDRAHGAFDPRARSRRDRAMRQTCAMRGARCALRTYTIATHHVLGALLMLLLPLGVTRAQGAIDCAQCGEWNVPQRPFRLHGTTYYVGTHGLGAILVTSPQGHVLIDGGLPQSAPLIRANVESLGFRMRDVKLILNSHAHYDHAGGIAELQRASDARVMASPWSAAVMRSGKSQPGDPQLSIAFGYAPVANVATFTFEDTLRVGPIAIVPHATPGHTPGGTTWSWRSCEGARCLDFVYADSQTPVSADDFLFTKNATYPNVIADFERGYATLARLSCDVLVTPHPGASALWDRVSPNDGTIGPAFVDREACRRYAANARRALEQRVTREQQRSTP